MNNYDFSQPQKENVAAAVFSAFSLLRGIIKGFWFFIVYIFVKDGDKILHSYWFYGAIGVLLLAMIIHGFFSWQNFYFYIKEGEFILEEGYLRKAITTLPLEKIISVNTNQKLLHQILGVVEVQIDSAGSQGKEVKIKAIKKAYAVALEEALAECNQNVEIQSTKEENHKIIMALSPLNLLKVSLGRNHLQGLALLLLFVNQLHSQLRDLFKDEVDSVIDETATTLEQSSLFIWVSIAGFVLLLSLVISIIRTYLFFFDLKLMQIKNSFLWECGLLKRKKITVPFSRVQAIKCIANPLQRLLKINSVRLIQASSKTQTKEADKIMIHGCSQEQMDTIRTKIQHFTFQNMITERPHWALRNRLFIINLIFVLPLLIWGYFSPLVFIFAGIYLAFIGLNAFIAHRRRSYRLNDEFLQIISGSFVHKHAFIELYKVQSVKLTQTFFQRRRNTANLRLGIAGTSVSIEYLDYEKAMKIKDFILYKIISTKKDWM